MDKTKKKYIVLVIVTIVISIVALIGASYALLTMTIEGEKKVSLTAGILRVDFEEGDNINLDNTAPLTDAQGQKTTPYTFTITNTGNINAYYHVSLEEDVNNTLSNSYLKMRLTSDNGYDSGVVKVSSYGTGSFDITSEATLEPSDKVTYQLWMWLDYNADNSAQGKEYKSKIVVTSYDREQGTNAVELVKSKANEESLDFNSATSEQQKEMWTFSHPETEQTEALTDYRYIGADPNNYVIFNNEIWRILGVFTVDDGTGKKEERVKIIRNELIVFEENLTSTNNYALSSIHEILNTGDYYNKTGNYSEIGLTENSKKMISPARWYLSTYGRNLGDASSWYIGERSHHYSLPYYIDCTVAFPYASDILYTDSTQNGNTLSENSWLYSLIGHHNVSTITPSDYLSTYIMAFKWGGNLDGEYGSGVVGGNSNLLSVYLNSDVVIANGDGSISNPYILKS